MIKLGRATRLWNGPTTHNPPPSPIQCCFQPKTLCHGVDQRCEGGERGWNLFLLRKLQVYNLNYALLVRSQGVLSQVVVYAATNGGMGQDFKTKIKMACKQTH